MFYALLTIAILLVILGHIFKIFRWGLYISVYEKTDYGNLLGALSVSQAINAVLPFRIGDILKVYISGRKMRNGYPFAVATVVVDLFVDLFTVALIFCGFAATPASGTMFQDIAKHYGIAVIVVFIVSSLCIIFKKQIKRLIAIFASIFNETLEFACLYTTYLIIASFKDILNNISKIRFVIYTVCMWTGYILSYWIFACSLQQIGINNSFPNVFLKLFSGAVLYNIPINEVFIWGIYLLVPLVICLVVSRCLSINIGIAEGRRALPQMSRTDRLAFLKTYYSNENKSHLKSYLDINSDVIVVEDNSAGSNASTVSVMRDEHMFFRKYAFEVDGEKLADQITWIEEHQADIPLPVISSKRIETDFSTYDMPSMSSAVGLFKYIHTMPTDKSWDVLRRSLIDIADGLHKKNCRPADEETICRYIKDKVNKNLQIINRDNRFITNLEKNNTIFINGEEYKTLKHYSDMFDTKHLVNVFKNDTYSDIHGDLTIENIVCLNNPDEINPDDFIGKVLPKDYYFIDPNTGNVHDSPFLDYGKLLQSLHGNYEFLMMVKKVDITKNSINFMMTKSEAYGLVYNEFKKYLSETYTEEQVRSIYYHEAIHWLRLMPYKIRKDERLAVVFYAGLLQVLADISKM